MEFWVLGSLDVTYRGRSLVGGTPRDRTVLAILLARVNETVGLDLLIDELWPEGPPAQARALARGYVSRIRRGFRDGPAGNVAARRLITRKPGYLLRVEDGELDLHRFEKAVADARRLSRTGDAERCRELLRRLRGLWRGAPFADVPPTSTIHATAAKLTEVRLATLEQLFDVMLDAGQDAEIVAELTELAAEYPLRERLVAQQMLALHRRGRTAEALDVYQRVKRQLIDELGIDPGAELQRRQLAILRNDPDVRPPPASPDQAPDTPNVSSTSAGAPLPVVPQQLPPESPLFTGRARELAELAEPDADDDAATLTIKVIDGMAGVGKTALAIHTAHRLAHRYPDGQLFLDLHGFTDSVPPVDPADALDRLLRGLGVPDDAIPNHPEDRSALLRTTLAGRRVLIVLDNAAGYDQVQPLMPGTPGCLVLITSRHQLADLYEAAPVSLDVLPPADAVALFTRIAERHRPAAAPSTLVTEIVELCGRLPLAIRIAAARLRAHPNWSLADLLNRLRDHQFRLAELRAGQRSVATALDLSYDHLTVHQQRAYRLLGLQFGSEINASAAAALIDTTPAQARTRLESLLHVHLISEPAPDFYRLHDLVRAHVVRTCREQEPEEERRAALARLLDHYAFTTTVAIDLLYPQEAPHRPFVTPSDDHPAGLATHTDAAAWLDMELPNLIAAAGHASAHGWPDHAIHLSGMLYPHLRVRGYLRYAEVLHTHALHAAQQTADSVGLQRALVGIADVHKLTGRTDTAAEHFIQAIDIAHHIGDRIGEHHALRGLGHVLYRQGRHTEAHDRYGQAHAIARDIGDPIGELHTLIGLAAIGHKLGRHDQATEQFSRALTIARDTGDRIGEMEALSGLADMHRLGGLDEQAFEQFSQALTIARDIGDRFGEMEALIGLGDIDRMQHRHEQAAAHYEQVLAIARDVGSDGYTVDALNGLGHTFRATGKPKEALALHRQALDLVQQGNSPEAARSHHGLAQAARALGLPDEAHRHFRDALAILTNLGLAVHEEMSVTEINAQLSDLTSRLAPPAEC
ncbi:AfsR/SARP family transcriptional regulator [Actinomadura sp. 3N407]|uniref:AfsR/SARP family transcriptional regulator n=1 Tax=Actinomadura sp. 3N407 TaxID=3457423 RepID=UPI003FCE7842